MWYAVIAKLNVLPYDRAKGENPATGAIHDVHINYENEAYAIVFRAGENLLNMAIEKAKKHGAHVICVHSESIHDNAAIQMNYYKEALNPPPTECDSWTEGQRIYFGISNAQPSGFWMRPSIKAVDAIS